jgi:phage tail tape-measure protein
MEPLTTAAIAIGAVVGKKALEKTGEKIGEALSNKISQFLTALKKQSPQTASAIEKVTEQPLDYIQAELEVESAAKANLQVNQAMQELAVAAKDEPNPKFVGIISTPNLQKLADKIVNYAARGDINVETQNITIPI